MPAQKGKDLLIKIEDEGAFVAVAGLRAREPGFAPARSPSTPKAWT